MTMVQQQSQHSSSSSSSSMDNGDSSSVRVAVRIRPFNSAERQLRAPSRTPQEPIQISQDNPIVTVLPDKKRFTFDYVFGTESTQQDVFDACVPSLLNKFIQGYNATILAYGQTSSGKTYTMGTGDACGEAPLESMGIIPRAIRTLFDELNAYKGPNRYQVRVSFLEVYNEELIDLLASEEGPRFPITIREDARGRIYWTGVREVTVRSPSEVMQQLAQGSWRRQVGHTDMNEKSSRSHAIFSVTLKQERPANSSATNRRYSSGLQYQNRALGLNGKGPANEKNHQRNGSSPLPSRLMPPSSRRNSGEEERDDDESTANDTNDDEWITVTGKFHFVDLAGSERLKRTNAVGDRAKEGISINAGLSALGNVISALGDTSRKVAHIPYRDSKLTRLLQDSLGGNSQTLMIACASPASVNVLETLNTLQYANRARNIKNKVSLNEEMSTDIGYLQAQVTKLRAEVKTLKMAASSNTENGKETSPRAISPIRAASPSPASPTAPSIPSPLSPFRFRSSSTGGNDVVPASAARRIQELETEVTRINASYQHLLVQFETICQSNSNLQLASAQNEYQKHAQSNHARSDSVTSTSYASSEQSMDVTDREYDNESIVDDDDEEEEEEEEEEEDEEETGISESEYGEETESEAETISSIGDRSESSACQGTPVIRPSNPRHSITSVNGDETFTGMTSFQQQVEPVIEEYEKVVAGLEAQLAETSEAIQEAEKQLQLYKERALQAEEIQQANNHELMELRAQLQQLEQAHMMYQEQAADVECAQSEIERLQRRVEDLEAQLEEEREATTAAIAAASEAASRLRTPDLRADHFAANSNSGRATPVLIRSKSATSQQSSTSRELKDDINHNNNNGTAVVNDEEEQELLPIPLPQPQQSSTPPLPPQLMVDGTLLLNNNTTTMEDTYLYTEVNNHHHHQSESLNKSRSNSRTSTVMSGSHRVASPSASSLSSSHLIVCDNNDKSVTMNGSEQLRDFKENPTAAAVLYRLRADLRAAEQRANRFTYINIMLFILCAYTSYWAYRMNLALPPVF